MYVKVWALFCCLFALSKNVGPLNIKIQPLVIGGSKAEDFSHPYMASLQFNRNGNWKHFCGAVLIAPDKLVTAAHCLYTKFTTTRIKIGSMDLENDGPKNKYSQARAVSKRNDGPKNKYSQARAVSKSIIHPGYNKSGQRHDIGVIYLTDPVVFNENVQVAEIARKGNNFERETCVITGWGISEEFPQGSSNLRDAFLKAISTAECATFDWDKRITNKEICVFDEYHDPDYRARSCQGDSGGALMCGLQYRYLAGVTSAGGSGCTGTKPSIYTRVSEYIDWINSV